MSEWKKQLEEFESLLQQIAEKKEDRKGLLRFDRCTICASDVAGQASWNVLAGKNLRVLGKRWNWFDLALGVRFVFAFSGEPC